MKAKNERYEALDILRGLTMIIMALDHSRDFFASQRRTNYELAQLAISRGIWLISLELTLVGFFWCFSTDFIYHPKIAVLFAIGVSMICMGLLIYLPKYMIAIIAISMILGHNALDSLCISSFGSYGWILNLIHVSGSFYIGDIEIRVVYPFVPWIGVMAAGYLLGPITKMPREKRRQIFLLIGLALLFFGFLLRYTNIYGDPGQWVIYDTFNQTLMSFLKFEKYPPSLIYLSVFLGFAMILLFALDRNLGKFFTIFKSFGQAPFFFYIIHIPILHLGGILFALFMFNDASWLFSSPLGSSPSEYTYSYPLLPTYLAWIGVIVLIYYPSKWFGELKKRRKDWWLSYL